MFPFWLSDERTKVSGRPVVTRLINNPGYWSVMPTANLSTTTTQVKQQYETFPYPYRDPAEDTRRVVRTFHDNLDLVNHYCYRGKRDYRRGFRVLVAGGGTGDATIFLAHQLADTDASIVHLDLSDASINVARQRARLHGLEEKITWIQGSLLELAEFNLEPFDYINCCGVLHHLDSPAAGLAALVSVLKDGGAIALLLYGRYGRIGVYQMQELMRLINRGEHDLQTMVDNTKEAFESLPYSNVLKRMAGGMANDASMNDAEFYDMFLHAKDRPFSVPEVYELLDGAGLELVEFCHTCFTNRSLYDYRHAFRSQRLRSQVEKLPPRQQQAAAELYWGAQVRHDFWASWRTDTIADPRDPQNVPFFSETARARGVRKSLLEVVDTPAEVWSASVKAAHCTKMSLKLVLNEVNRQWLRLIDGSRTTGEIVRTIAADAGLSYSEEEISNLCCKAFESLRMFDFVLLRHVSVPPANGP